MILKKVKSRLEKIIPYTKNGHERYYINAGWYSSKAKAYFSFSKDTGKYEWTLKDGGYIYAEKTYNGRVIEEINEWFGDGFEQIAININYQN